MPKKIQASKVETNIKSDAKAKSKKSIVDKIWSTMPLFVV